VVIAYTLYIALSIAIGSVIVNTRSRTNKPLSVREAVTRWEREVVVAGTATLLAYSNC
jgi:hypothetical protein